MASSATFSCPASRPVQAVVAALPAFTATVASFGTLAAAAAAVAAKTRGGTQALETASGGKRRASHALPPWSMPRRAPYCPLPQPWRFPAATWAAACCCGSLLPPPPPPSPCLSDCCHSCRGTGLPSLADDGRTVASLPLPSRICGGGGLLRLRPPPPCLPGPCLPSCRLARSFTLAPCRGPCLQPRIRALKRDAIFHPWRLGHNFCIAPTNSCCKAATESSGRRHP